jgi:DNA-binding transcriptional LysR family regulator
MPASQTETVQPVGRRTLRQLNERLELVEELWGNVLRSECPPEQAERVLQLKQLCREALIVREPGSGTRRCLEQALDEHGLSTNDMSIAMEVNSNDAIRAAVERGVGVAFLSQGDKRRDVGLASISVRNFRPRRQLYVISDPFRVLPTPARQFLSFVKQWRSAAP